MSPTVPDVPGPWTLYGEAYWMLLMPMKTLPVAAYAPQEDAQVTKSEYLGGQGAVQILRYSDSPAGPYDELIYTAGDFKAPSGTAHPQITRIYVSTDISVYNGRKNWNIPKHRARFSFTPVSLPKRGSTLIEVSPATPADAPPFFSAVATPSWIPAIPMTTSVMPLHLPLVQPPIPPSNSPDEDPSIVIGTDTWKSVSPTFVGNFKIMWYAPGSVAKPGNAKDCGGIPEGEYSDGVGFPKITPRSIGAGWLDGTRVDFPAGGDKECK